MEPLRFLVEVYLVEDSLEFDFFKIDLGPRREHILKVDLWVCIGFILCATFSGDAIECLLTNFLKC